MKYLIKTICILLVVATVLAIPVAAEEASPYASNYFMSHSTYLWKTSSTSFQVWFDVTAVSGMSELGVDYIDIERSSDGTNWSVVKTYSQGSYSNLVASNTGNHCSYVTYSNMQSGYQYRAYVKFYAKNTSGGRGYSGAYAYF